MYYLNTFLIYSFIGFIIESVLGVIKGKKIGSGILYGPWTPIYGVGCVLILLISNFIFKILNFNNVLELIISTILITIISILVIYILQPLIDKFIFYIPNYISFILISLMIIDFIIIFINKKPHK